MSDTPFIPGLKLAEGFFAEHVEPLLTEAYPTLRYSAALIGDGSEVLGFDTPVSTDHHWGPRLMLFLAPQEYGSAREDIRHYLSCALPSSYRGYSTHFTPPDPNDNGVRHMFPHDGGPVDHMVELTTIEGYFREYLRLNIAEPLTPAAWLSLPTQKLRCITAGAVFRDDLGLERIRQQLSWYPTDVWLYILGSLWTRIGQEEHLMGRAGQVGDELGSSLIGSRLARDIMRIGFCLERQYPPYPKWFGTAFGKLACALSLQPMLEAVVYSRTWKERESALCSACERLVQLQRECGIADGTEGRVSNFHGRPFLVIGADRIASAVFSGIADPNLRALAGRRPIGSINTVSDSTDVLEDADISEFMRPMYQR